jgi:hypothetical protein
MMEYFYSGGGSNNPRFPYRIKVNQFTSDMYTWCEEYPVTGSGYFQRFHVEWSTVYNKEYDVVQFEWEEPAIMFALKFGVKG